MVDLVRQLKNQGMQVEMKIKDSYILECTVSQRNKMIICKNGTQSLNKEI